VTVPRRGYRFVAPVEVLFTGLAEEAALEMAPPPPGVERKDARRLWARAVTTAVAVMVAFAALLWFRHPEQAPVIERFTIVTPEPAATPVISPNGRHVAYICGVGENARLCIQDLDRFEPRKIPGSSRVQLHPFWSPDSRQLSFASAGALWIMPIAAGEPVQACRLPGPYLGGAWDPAGDSVFLAIDHQGIFELTGLKGTPKLVIPIDRERWGPHFEIPSFLPSGYGRVLLYSAQSRDRRHVAVLHDLRSGKTEIVAPNGMAAFSPTGHVIYPYHLNIWAAPISPRTLRVAADPFPIGRSGQGVFPSISSQGTLAYLELDWQKRLVWLDGAGTPLEEDQGLGELILSLALSPEGTRAAVTIWAEDSQTDIWVWDLLRKTRTRLTFGPARESAPVWNPAGDTITYSSNQKGNLDIFQKLADGTGNAVPLVVTPQDESPETWSSDGKVLVYRVLDPERKTDLWVLGVCRE
jgi:hypothetical protein